MRRMFEPTSETKFNGGINMRTTIEAKTNGHGQAKDHDEKSIEVPALKIKSLELGIVGVSSLIVHAWDPKCRREMLDGMMGKAKLKKAPKNPEADFKAAKYLDAKGRDCAPVIAFKHAIVSAARFAGKELPMTVLRGAFFIHGDTKSKVGEDLALLTFDECIMREDMVRVGMGKPDIRFRPEYVSWKCKLKIEYNSRSVTAEQIVNLVRHAGYGVGICEWRPEKHGQFGRFTVDESVIGDFGKATH